MTQPPHRTLDDTSGHVSDHEWTHTEVGGGLRTDLNQNDTGHESDHQTIESAVSTGLPVSTTGQAHVDLHNATVQKLVSVNEDRPAGATYLTTEDPWQSIINSGSVNQQFVLAPGVYTAINDNPATHRALRLKNGMGIWSEFDPSLVSITETWNINGQNLTPSTGARKVQCSTKFVFPSPIITGIWGSGSDTSPNYFTGTFVGFEAELNRNVGASDGQGQVLVGFRNPASQLRKCNIHDGKNNALGGFNGLIEDCELHHAGYWQSGLSSSLFKTANGPVTMRRVYAHDGAWNGLWNDCRGTKWLIEDCFVVDIQRNGVFYEISMGQEQASDGMAAHMTDSTVWRCNLGNYGSDVAGVRMVSSRKWLIEESDIRANVGRDVVAWNDSRAARSGYTYPGSCTAGSLPCQNCGWNINDLTIRNTIMDPTRINAMGSPNPQTEGKITLDNVGLP